MFEIDIELINNQTNISAHEIEQELYLKVLVEHGDWSDKHFLNFTWNVTEFTGRIMKIQLYFENAKYVSSWDEPETLVASFLHRKFFLGVNGEYLLTK